MCCLLISCSKEDPENQYYLDLIFDGRDKDYIEDYFTNNLKPKYACRTILEFFYPGYEPYKVIEGDIYWDRFILVKDFFKELKRYSSPYVPDFRTENIRWRLFPRNLEDIQYSGTFQNFANKIDYPDERIELSCEVIYKDELNIAMDIKMEFFNTCTPWGDNVFFYAQYDPTTNNFEVSDEKYAYKDYRWDGQNWFDDNKGDYLSNRRTCPD